MLSVSWLILQGCFASLMPTKVLRKSQKTLVGTYYIFLCLGHVNLTNRKSSPTKPRQQKSSLSHDWFSKDVLPVWCPQRSSGGLKRHLWAPAICLCALDIWIWPTEKVLHPNLGRKKVLWIMIGSPRMFCQFDAHKGPQEVSTDTCGHFQYDCMLRTY